MKLPFYGFAMLCYDHSETRKLGQMMEDKIILSYGINSSDVDIRGLNLQSMGEYFIFDVCLSSKVKSAFREVKNIYLPMHGQHNILNALAAIGMAAHLGVSAEIIQNGFRNFTGIKRRFTYVGTLKGVSIIDDYAHHPVEIAATIQAAQQIATNRVIVIFQPHRYSRVAALFNEFVKCFKGVNILIVTDIYSAGEAPISNINSEGLIEAIAEQSDHPTLYKFNLDDQLVAFLADNMAKGDIILAMGAGNITYFANQLVNKLEQYFHNKTSLADVL